MNDISWTTFIGRRFKNNLQDLENSSAEEEIKRIFNPIIKSEKNPQHANFCSIAGRIRCLITCFAFFPTFIIEEGYLLLKIGYNVYQCSLSCCDEESENNVEQVKDLIKKVKLATLLPFSYLVKIPMLAAGALLHPRIVFATDTSILPTYHSPSKLN